MSMGTLSRFGVGAASPATLLLDLLSGDVGLQESHTNGTGVRGTRSRHKSRTRKSLRRASGSITIEPNVQELLFWLPYILGGTPSGTTFPLGETLSSFICQKDMIEKVFTYTGCKIASATFRSSQGSPLQLTLNIEGVDETIGNAGTFPAIELTEAAPFVHHDGAFVINSISGRTFFDYELTIDNMLDGERFGNSATRTALNPTDRMITVGLTPPYGGNHDMYNLLETGVPIVATFTNGTVSVAFSTPFVQIPRNTPLIAGKAENRLLLRGEARSDDANEELVVTLDSTP